MGYIGTKPSAVPLTSADITDGIITVADIASGTDGLFAWQSVQTTGFTAVAARAYPCNTTSSAFTVTLPASPSVGDQVLLLDYAGTFATNNLTLNPNSLKIEGGTASKLLTTNREAVTLTYVDSTQGWLASSGVNEGTVALTSQPIEFLVVGGGGGTTGNRQGGGGAGGYRTSSQVVSSGTVITVTVGAGGAGGGSSGTVTSTQDGTASSISGSGLTTISSAGGGGAGQSAARDGGSGGGGCNVGGGQKLGGAGNTPSTSPVQGYKGGDGSSGYGTGAGSGGGGAGAAGTDGTGSGSTGTNGGIGIANSITGSSVYYAGGGGGGGSSGGSNTSGGLGGGGVGRAGAPSTQLAGDSGTTNTGGGGGGGTDYSSTFVTQSSGGSGVVILSLPTSLYTGTTSGSPTVTTKNAGADTVLTFTGSGTYTAQDKLWHILQKQD